MALAGVKPLPDVAWQLVQLVAPVWFIVAGAQLVPMLWQLPHALLVIGATVCALAPVGKPLAAMPLWQVVQLLALVMPLWLKLVGVHAVVRWQLEHWA